MLSQDILTAISTYTNTMTHTVRLVLNTGEHAKKAELREFLTSFCSASEHLEFVEQDINTQVRSPISFLLQLDGENTGVSFSGIPSGHEFNSLVLAVLHADKPSEKLDAHVKAMIEGISQPLNFEVFVSLSCHNCPDVVQTLNQFALLNPNIQTEMIDGGLYPELIEARNIQGVPSVYLNGELFANGKLDMAQIIEKLQAHHIELSQPSDTPLALQDATVIGGGPAGVSAAIYLARKGLAVTMIADTFGGQVKDTVAIENLISVSKTTGAELANNLLAHLNDYDITLKEHFRVEQVKDNPETGNKVIELSSGEVIDSKTVIVATGAKWRELGVPGEAENIGQGVAYCPHCDGPFFKGKEVAVIGGGNSGIEAALDLAGIVKSVTVFEFMPTLKADQVLIDQIEKRDNITVIKNAASKEVIAQNGKVVALDYIERDTETVKRQDLEGIFVQIGLAPNSQFLKGVVEQSPHGEIIINERCETSQAGIFAAGDVTTVPYKQIIVAMGEGSKAALAAYDYLMKL